MHFVFHIIFIWFFLSPTAAATEERIAVLALHGLNVEDSNVLMTLSNSVRVGISKIIDKKELMVMTNDSVLSILEDNGKDASCVQGDCVITVGRNINADYVISGTVTQISKSYIVTLELHSTQSAGLLSSEQIKEVDILKLVDKMPSVGQSLMCEAGLVKERCTPAATPQGGFSGESANEWTARNRMQPANAVVQFETSPSGAGIVVMIDDTLTCTETPCSKSMQPGVYNIVIQKKNYKPWNKTLNITQNQTVKANLTSTFGYLTLSSSYDNVAFSLNNKQRLWTPLRDKKFPKGTHSLVLVDSCYQGKKGNAYTFEIKEGEHKSVSFPVVARPAGVKISVDDGNGNDLAANVYVDDRYIGQSPNTFTVGVCSQKMRIEYQQTQKTIALSLREKEVSTIHVSLPRTMRITDSVTERNTPTIQAKTVDLPVSGYSDEIIIASGAKFPPMFDLTGTKPFGFEIDLGREIAKRMGRTARFIRSSSARYMVRKGEADIALASVSITEKRKNVHRFSIPYFHNDYVVVQSRLHNLSGNDCAVGPNTIYKQQMRKWGCDIVSYKSNVRALKAVKNGTVRYSITERTRLLNEPDLRIVTTLGSDPYGIVLPQNESALERDINDIVQAIMRDGTYERLMKKHGLR